MADIGVLSVNISGVEGLEGNLNGTAILEGTLGYAVGTVYDIYDGPIIVTPKADGETVLETANMLVMNDITVLEIPYYETTNLSGGYTVYIGGD